MSREAGTKREAMNRYCTVFQSSHLLVHDWRWM